MTGGHLEDESVVLSPFCPKPGPKRLPIRVTSVMGGTIPSGVRRPQSHPTCNWKGKSEYIICRREEGTPKPVSILRITPYSDPTPPVNYPDTQESYGEDGGRGVV